MKRIRFQILLGIWVLLWICPLTAKDNTDALIEEAMRVFGQNGTPSDSLPVKCAFGIVHAIRSHVPAGDARIRSLSAYLSRPTSLPLSIVSPRGLFRIHYTISGRDAVSTEDMDGSGIPDYVEAAASIMDSVYHVEIEVMGFQPPPADPADGPEWDVYLLYISGNYGSTEEDALLSENPSRYTSYLDLDNSYARTNTKGLNGLRVTAAHEFFHMIQLGYGVWETTGDLDDRFIMEASATWMEDQVFDWINDYYFYLSKYFKQARLPFNYVDYSSREYGLCLWFHFLDQRLGTNDGCRIMWTKMQTMRAMDALRELLIEHHRSFENEMAIFYGWNCMTGSRADTVHFYPEGAHYPEVTPTVQSDFNWDITVSDSLIPSAAAYYLIRPQGGTPFFLVPVNVNLNGSPYGYGRFTLAVMHGTNHELYTDLGGGNEARIIAELPASWRCNAALYDPAIALVSISGSTDDSMGKTNATLPPAYPNPFVPGSQLVRIPFFPGQDGSARVQIFSASGYRIWELDMDCKAGAFAWFVWDGKDEHGSFVSSGIYPYVIIQDQTILRRAVFAVIR
jgi:hypothetical protein